MDELFMKYPIGSEIEHEGKKWRVSGYEVYNGKKILICVDGEMDCRIDVNKSKMKVY